MEDLTRTDRTQLTILTCSVAAWRVLEEKGAHVLGRGRAFAGRVLRPRGERPHDLRRRPARRRRARPGHAGLRRAEGRHHGCHHRLDDAAVEEICASLSEVWVANYNSPGQIVISGSVGVGRRRPASWPRRPVQPGCCHSRSRGRSTLPFIEGAAVALQKALADVTFLPGTGKFLSTTEVRYPEPGETGEGALRPAHVAGQVHAEHAEDAGRAPGTVVGPRGGAGQRAVGADEAHRPGLPDGRDQ